jgi:hypothetical protein
VTTRVTVLAGRPEIWDSAAAWAAGLAGFAASAALVAGVSLAAVASSGAYVVASDLTWPTMPGQPRRP